MLKHQSDGSPIPLKLRALSHGCRDTSLMVLPQDPGVFQLSSFFRTKSRNINNIRKNLSLRRHGQTSLICMSRVTGPETVSTIRQISSIGVVLRLLHNLLKGRSGPHRNSAYTQHHQTTLPSPYISTNSVTAKY